MSNLNATTKSELLYAAARMLAHRELAQENFIHFCSLMYSEWETNWHHVLIADAIDRLFLPLDDPNHLRRLIISLPPRHGKSQMVSRLLPPYIFSKDPTSNVISASYSGVLAERMSRDANRFMQSDAYKAFAPHVKLPSNKQKSFSNTRDFWELINGGSYKAVGAGGSLTGSGGNWLILDDAVKGREQADSPVSRESLAGWYDSVFRTRTTGDARIVVIGTRWNVDDLMGKLINADADENIPDNEKEHWYKIILPALAEGELMQNDPRKEDQALWPEKYSKHSLKILRASLSEKDWQSLYMCNPILGGSSEWNANLFNNIYVNELPAENTGSVISIDAALGNTEVGDYSALCYMSRGVDGNLYSLFNIERMAVGNLLDLLVEYTRKLKPDVVSVEVNAFQQLLLYQIKQRFASVGLSTPIIPVKNNIKKEIRIRRLGPYFEKGLFKVVGPNKSSKLFVKEASTFPTGANDDGLDAAEQALRVLIQVSNKKVSTGLIKLDNTPPVVPEASTPVTTMPPQQRIVVSAAEMNRAAGNVVPKNHNSKKTMYD